MGRKVGGGPTASVRVTVPENTVIEQGKFYLINNFFGMALKSVTTGVGETKPLTLDIEQTEFETSQITATDAFNVGDLVYWNAATGLLTTQANPDASGNPQNRVVGRVTSAKDANGVIWVLLGPQVQAH